MGLHKSTVAIVITTAKNSASQVLFATYFLSVLSFLAPKLCAIGIAKPLQMPMQKPIIRKFMEPVLPTAANDFTPRNFPTIMVSTRL